MVATGTGEGVWVQEVMDARGHVKFAFEAGGVQIPFNSPDGVISALIMSARFTKTPLNIEHIEEELSRYKRTMRKGNQ